jgi:hypothetical protein
VATVASVAKVATVVSVAKVAIVASVAKVATVASVAKVATVASVAAPVGNALEDTVTFPVSTAVTFAFKVERVVSVE